MSDLYTELGVQKNASSDDIKKAYRKLAAKLHPDRHPGDHKAEARFKEVNRAYQVLSDPKKRRLYDEFGEDGLREGFNPEVMRAYRRGTGGAGALSAQRHRGQRRGLVQRARRAGRRRRVHGSVRRSVRRPRARGGAGRGGDEGLGQHARGHAWTSCRRCAAPSSSFRLRTAARSRCAFRRAPAKATSCASPAAARPGALGGPPGDLVIVIRVAPHPHFRRDGLDLHLDLPITVAEAYRRRQGARSDPRRRRDADRAAARAERPDRAAQVARCAPQERTGRPLRPLSDQAARTESAELERAVDVLAEHQTGRSARRRSPSDQRSLRRSSRETRRSLARARRRIARAAAAARRLPSSA